MIHVTAAALILLSMAVPTADPWAVPASWEVEAHEIRFDSDGIELTGTLYAPEGAENGPGLVVVQQTNTNVRSLPFFERVASRFNAIGYSVFLYDRRGSGESEGELPHPDYPLLAGDAVAAKRAIGKTEFVDSGRVGFWGHSQGGWLAMMAGAKSDAAFVISVAAPLTTPSEQMAEFAYNHVLQTGHGPQAAERARQTRLTRDAYYRGEASYAEAHRALAAVDEEPWFDLIVMAPAEQLPTEPPEAGWITEMDFDPVAPYTAVEAPLLLMLGGGDPVIPVQRTLDIAGEVETADRRDIVVIPEADHGMEREGSDGRGKPAEYFMTVGAWVGSLDGGGDSALASGPSTP